MPIQEAVIALMDAFIAESSKDGIVNKIKIAQSLIPLLYGYLREMGVSDDEIKAYYDKDNS